MKLAIVIPALNEELKIAPVIEAIQKATADYHNSQIFVIDDGSEDATAELARAQGATVISHSSNCGVGAAFHTGLQAALDSGADIMVNIDADGQFRPTDIPKLLDPILKGTADFVTADRFSDEEGRARRPKHMSFVKFWGNQQITRLISTLTRKSFRDVSCGFRAYSREAMLNLNLRGRFTYTQESFLDLATKGLRIQSIPVHVTYFPDRKSRVASSIVKYALRTSGIIFRTYRDHQPLRFFGALGAVIFVLGLFADIFVLQHYFSVGSFSPFKFVMLSGVYLNTLGVVIWIVGLVADMLDRIRSNQEKILYLLKTQDLQQKTSESVSSQTRRIANE